MAEKKQVEGPPVIRVSTSERYRYHFSTAVLWRVAIGDDPPLRCDDALSRYCVASELCCAVSRYFFCQNCLNGLFQSRTELLYVLLVSCSQMRPLNAFSASCIAMLLGFSSTVEVRQPVTQNVYYGRLWNRADHYIFALWFLSSIFFYLFSSPNFSGRRLDVYHAWTHAVVLVQI